MGFFDELKRLHETQPHPAILTVKSENSEYCPYHGEGKNSYMIVGHMRAEDCLYGFWVGDARDCVDCAFTEKSEFCYECVDCRDCYSSNYCQDCLNCSFCEFCYDCKGCMNCFGCVNLRNKEYYIFNEKYDKATYEQKMQVLRKEYYSAAGRQNPVSGSLSPAGDRQFHELVRTLPHNYLQGFQNENVIGDHIFHARNAFYCFDVNEIEDCFYMFNAYTVKDSMDTAYTNIQSELNYMCMSAVNIFNSNYCSVCWYSQNLEYCEYVYNSHDCFGCVSRNHAEYEILNKKYSKDDYFKKVREIKEQSKTEGSYGRWWWPPLYPELQPTPSYMALQYYRQSVL